MRLPLSTTQAVRKHTPDTLTIAHRGASEEVAENTLAAIRRAIAHDADLVEVDVQRTRDGELVLMHDTTLLRTTDARRVFPDRGPWRVGDFTYAELQRLDAGAWHSAGFSGERVPRLADAVDVVRPSRAGLLVEVKAPELHPGIAADVVATLRSAPSYLATATAQGRLVVQSFDAEVARTVKELEPRVPVGLLGSPPRSALPAVAEWADQVNPSHVTVDRRYVDELHRLGMGCLVWTVNRGPAMRRAVRLGVDGVITNRPGAFRRVLAARDLVGA